VHTNAFDSHIIHFVNSFAHRSWTIDAFILLFTSNDLLKGALPASLFWWAWVRRDKTSSEQQQVLMFGVVASIFSVLLTRLMTLALPFRIRPLHNPELHFQLPYTVTPDTLAGWSSFPSDHMVLYACLAATIWLVNRRVGTIALLYAVVFVGFSRIYAGYHYPTDILVGTAVGIGCGMLARIGSLRKIVIVPALWWFETRPAALQAFMFICTFEIAEGFASGYLVLLYLTRVCKLL
jgi:undecaprenyl-diphosphatase